MVLRHVIIRLTFIFFTFLGVSSLAQADYFPELKNTKGKETHDLPMGPVGGVMRIKWDTSSAEIVDLMKSGPGDKAGLEVGDVILKIDGRRSRSYSSHDSTGGEGPPEDLGEAILKAQASGKDLVLEVQKVTGEKTEVAVSIPAREGFSSSFPLEADAFSQEYTDAIREKLSDLLKDDGSIRGDYTTAFVGLAFLSCGKEGYKDARKVARYLADKYTLPRRKPTREMLIEHMNSNWKVTQVGIFLAEYFLATGDKFVTTALQHCCDRMAARVNYDTGRFGHGGIDLPYGGKGLAIINTHAHLMWVLAAHAGCQIDEEAWHASMKCVKASLSSEGAVGYNFSARSGSQAGARTGSLTCALALSGLEKKMLRNAGDWLEDHYKEFPDAHAMTSIGLIYGTFGLKAASTKKWAEHMKYYRWMYALTSPVDWDHGAYYFGQKGNHGGDGYLGYNETGNFMNLLLLNSWRNDTLWMLGNRTENWLK